MPGTGPQGSDHKRLVEMILQAMLTYVCTHTHIKRYTGGACRINIYIYREREREIYINIHTHVSTYTWINHLRYRFAGIGSHSSGSVTYYITNIQMYMRAKSASNK